MISEYVKDISFEDIKNGNNGNMPCVYQLTFPNRLKSIFRNGFSAEFAASAGGNFYCKGLYTTFSLRSTIKNLQDKGSLYGTAILKEQIPSYEGFLIFNKEIAKQTYGNDWHYLSQLKMFFPDKKIGEWHSKGILSTITNEYEEWTAKNVQTLLHLGLSGMRCASDQDLTNYGVQGFLFKGHNDGKVCIIRDFKRILPLEYSLDGGQTFKNDLLTQRTFEKSFKEYDPEMFLGKDAPKYVSPEKCRMINNYMKVQRKTDKKYNFISEKDKSILSPLWFDMASDMGSNHMAFVSNQGETFYVGENGYYENENDDFPFATFDEI